MMPLNSLDRSLILEKCNWQTKMNIEFDRNLIKFPRGIQERRMIQGLIIRSKCFFRSCFYSIPVCLNKTSCLFLLVLTSLSQTPLAPYLDLNHFETTTKHIPAISVFFKHFIMPPHTISMLCNQLKMNRNSVNQFPVSKSPNNACLQRNS